MFHKEISNVVRLAILTSSITLLTSFASISAFGDAKKCDIQLKELYDLDEQKLKHDMEDHRFWLDEVGRQLPENFRRTDTIAAILSDSRRLVLCRPDYYSIEDKDYDLDLDWADLIGARFVGNLAGASFQGSKIPWADFNNTIVPPGISFSGAILRDGSFLEAQLLGSPEEPINFDYADLRGVSFLDSDLVNVRFQGTDLSNADFTNTDFSNVVFEPDSDSLPIVHKFARAKGLRNLRFSSNPDALEKLRRLFREKGFREQANEVSAALGKSHRIRDLSGSLFSVVNAMFQYVFFELPVDYGAAQGRPLLILLVGIFVFAIPYFFSLTSNETDGIWLVWNETRIRQDIGFQRPLRLKLRVGRAILIALYFSTLSAFHVGWRDLNVGTWISKMQPREYVYSASGWMRTLSGFQSIVSVYLLAIWALTYFGEPFG